MFYKRSVHDLLVLKIGASSPLYLPGNEPQVRLKKVMPEPVWRPSKCQVTRKFSCRRRLSERVDRPYLLRHSSTRLTQYFYWVLLIAVLTTTCSAVSQSNCEKYIDDCSIISTSLGCTPDKTDSEIDCMGICPNLVSACSLDTVFVRNEELCSEVSNDCKADVCDTIASCSEVVNIQELCTDIEGCFPEQCSSIENSCPSLVTRDNICVEMNDCVGSIQGPELCTTVKQRCPDLYPSETDCSEVSSCAGVVTDGNICQEVLECAGIRRITTQHLPTSDFRKLLTGDDEYSRFGEYICKWLTILDGALCDGIGSAAADNAQFTTGIACNIEKQWVNNIEVTSPDAVAFIGGATYNNDPEPRDLPDGQSLLPGGVACLACTPRDRVEVMIRATADCVTLSG